MTATLRESQKDLPRLVEVASQGEDVVITVDGKPKAKLTRAEPVKGSELSQDEMKRWLAELAELRARFATGKTTPTSEELIEEDRADRV